MTARNNQVLPTFIITGQQQPEGQKDGIPDSFILHVDLWGLPALGGFLQACLQPDALQLFLKLDLRGQRGGIDTLSVKPDTLKHCQSRSTGGALFTCFLFRRPSRTLRR